MEYNTALCDFLVLPPDPCTQLYRNVTTQVYPLRADRGKINNFCETYLNKSPDEFFEPLAPWIMMQVCAYGEMEFADTSVYRFAHRWFSQHELAFGIPVRCSDINGKLKDIGIVYPFIFVDSSLSMEGGRQVYGWPKAGIELVRTKPGFQPNDPRSVVRIKISPFTLDKVEAREEDDQPFVEVFQTRPFLSGRSGVAGAITSVPRMMGSYLSAAAGVIDSIASLISGYRPPNTGTTVTDLYSLGADLQSLGEVIQKSYGYLNSLMPTLLNMTIGRTDSSSALGGPNVTIFTMKQVRDADKTTDACYQAIVRSQMTVKEVKDAGFLFDPLSGDPTGGIEIKLRSTGNYMDKLIEMVSPGSKSNGSGDWHGVRPLVPFWETIDVSYGLANAQSWRTKYTPWKQEPPLGSSTSSSPVSREAPSSTIVYEKRGSGGALAVSGKRTAEDAVLHVFMIPANRQRLQSLIDRYLNDLSKPNKTAGKPYFEFRVKADPDQPFIYVTVLNYDKMTIEGSDESYGDTVLTFLALAEYYRVNEEGNRQGTPTYAFIPLYTFVGTDWNFVTEYEVYGRVTFKSDMVTPMDSWVKQSAPSGAPHEVFSVRTTVFPDPSKQGGVSGPLGKKATSSEVVRISSKPSTSQSHETHFIAADDPARFSELDKYGLAEYLTLESGDSLANVRTFQSIALKQVRDAMHGAIADYQSLVGIERSFSAASNFTESLVKVTIINQNGLPILQEMALEVSPYASQVTFDATALSFTGTLVEQQGRELWWRVAPDEVWTERSS